MRVKRGSGFAASPWGMLVLMTCVLALACHGDDGGPAALAFRCSDAAVPADTVALACGALSQGTDQEIEVVIGGPTTSTDIKGFSFDVVFEPANVSYVAGSASQGTLLNSDGDDPLLAVSLASNDPGRLLVGIHRTAQAGGVQGTAARTMVLSFSLRSDVLVGFGPDLLRFENFEAVDSSGSPIAGITASDQLLLSVQ